MDTTFEGFRSLDRESLTVYTPGTRARDFIHLQDIARAYECAIEVILVAEPGTRTLTIGSGECVSVNELAETVERVAGEEIGTEPEIALVENPRAFETIIPESPVETGTARDVIGFEPEWSLEVALWSMLSQ